MIAPDTFLGISIIVIALSLIFEVYYRTRDLDALLGPYALMNIVIALTAGVMAFYGFFDTLQSSLDPVVQFLLHQVGTPDRFGDAARYTPSDVIRVLFVIPVFLYASYRDIKERIVRNWVWLPLFGYGIVLLIYDFWTGNNIQFLAPWVLGNTVFAITIGWVLFKTKLFGGADMKAIWALGFILPTYPALVVFPRVLPPLLATPHTALNMFALTILANTAIAAMFWPLHTLATNIRDGSFNIKRPGLMFTARRVPLQDALNHHGRILPVWTFNGNGIIGRGASLIKTVMYGIDNEFVADYIEWHNFRSETEIADPTDIDTIYVERFLDSKDNMNADGEPVWETENLEQATEAIETVLDQESVWMTPGIPFIVPMTLGLLLSLFVGDIVYWVVIALN